jgi:hypothetical protein
MKDFWKFCFAILFTLAVSGCKADNLREMSSKSISIEFNGEQCLPLESFVPAGEEISVKFSNTSKTNLSWYIVIFPIDDERELTDQENVYFSESVPSGEEKEFQFIPPKLTARYETYCVPEDSPDQRILKYLLVVEPKPTETQP